ncbi:hypothetical protein TMPK1_38740 [Rhodospirillales bacterium TMPK1]|uniref:Uncharacterized protein n=1 Tax=Roseiterribacter gracilis TaxID=2812848 RepID=A0A8S8XIY5_9PROT|nr:hypothetical protein TMPK1_38740 [Rhodospirillales bacterium TMPK1]
MAALAPIPTAPIVQLRPTGRGAPPPTVQNLPPRHVEQLPHVKLPAATSLFNGSTASAPAGGSGGGAGGIY